MTKRKTFTKEFKLEAVKLLEMDNRSASELALELGVRRNQLYKWQEQYRKHGVLAFQGPGHRPANQDDEVARLKRELAEV